MEIAFHQSNTHLFPFVGPAAWGAPENMPTAMAQTATATAVNNDFLMTNPSSYENPHSIPNAATRRDAHVDPGVRPECRPG